MKRNKMLLPTRVARCVQFSHWAGFLIFVFHETKLKSRNFVFLSKFLARSQPWGFSPYTHEKVWYAYQPTPLPPPPPPPVTMRPRHLFPVWALEHTDSAPIGGHRFLKCNGAVS